MQSSDGHRRRKARLCMSNQTRLQKTRSAESVPLQVGPVCSARPRGHVSSAVHELGAAGGAVQVRGRPNARRGWEPSSDPFQNGFWLKVTHFVTVDLAPPGPRSRAGWTGSPGCAKARFSNKKSPAAARIAPGGHSRYYNRVRVRKGACRKNQPVSLEM